MRNCCYKKLLSRCSDEIESANVSKSAKLSAVSPNKSLSPYYLPFRVAITQAHFQMRRSPLEVFGSVRSCLVSRNSVLVPPVLVLPSWSMSRCSLLVFRPLSWADRLKWVQRLGSLVFSWKRSGGTGFEVLVSQKAHSGRLSSQRCPHRSFCQLKKIDNRFHWCPIRVHLPSSSQQGYLIGKYRYHEPFWTRERALSIHFVASRAFL